MLSERSHKSHKKATCCMIPFIWNTQMKQIHKDSKQISGCQGLGGENGNDCLTDKEFPFGVMRIWNYILMMAAQHHKCTKYHWTVYFKMVKKGNLMLWLFYHTKKATIIKWGKKEKKNKFTTENKKKKIVSGISLLIKFGFVVIV